MKEIQIKAVETAQYPGINSGYLTVTMQVTDTKNAINVLRVVTVPALEL